MNNNSYFKNKILFLIKKMSNKLQTKLITIFCGYYVSSNDLNLYVDNTSKFYSLYNMIEKNYIRHLENMIYHINSEYNDTLSGMDHIFYQEGCPNYFDLFKGNGKTILKLDSLKNPDEISDEYLISAKDDLVKIDESFNNRIITNDFMHIVGRVSQELKQLDLIQYNIENINLYLKEYMNLKANNSNNIYDNDFIDILFKDNNTNPLYILDIPSAIQMIQGFMKKKQEIDLKIFSFIILNIQNRKITIINDKTDIKEYDLVLYERPKSKFINMYNKETKNADEIKKSLRQMETPVNMTEEEIISTDKINYLDELEINNLEINVFSRENIDKIAIMEVKSPDANGPGGANDLLMGPNNNINTCSTCHRTIKLGCPGHHGKITLNEPVYNPIFFSMILKILQVFCHCCGRLLVSDSYLRDEGILRMSPHERLKIISKKFFDVRCTRNNEKKGFNISPCNNNPKISKNISEKNLSIYFIDPTSKKAPFLINISEISKILSGLNKDDLEILGFKNINPKDFIMEVLPVIPPRDRPPNTAGDSIHPNQFTTYYCEIIMLNNKIAEETDQTTKSDLKRKLIAKINELMGKNITTEKKQNLKSRLTGKTGEFRKIILGKRINSCARTVISPGYNLNIGEIEIPEQFRHITIEETVFKYNLEYVKNLIDNDQVLYIQSCIMIDNSPGQPIRKLMSKKIIKGIDKKNIRIKIGDVIHRYIRDSDVVIFNRQPTLHKHSITAHKIKFVKNSQTIRMPLAITDAYNADFDGDEMNLHVVQQLVARAEAMVLLDSREMVLQGMFGGPIYGPKLNALTAIYLLGIPGSIKRPEIQINDISNYFMHINGPDKINTIIKRLEYYNIPKNSARALFSLTLPPYLFYEKGNVKIKNGVWLSGEITQDIIGKSNMSIIHKLAIHYGSSVAADFIDDYIHIMDIFIERYGFSIGYDDCSLCYLDDKINFKKIVDAECSKAQVVISSTDDENIILDAISNITENVSTKLKQTIEESNTNNSFLTMVNSGSRGGKGQLCQSAAIIGQQKFVGKRIKKDITNNSRTLPVFSPGEESIEARGFIKNSYIDGTNPAETYFIHYAGREGIVDSAIKTGQSGFIQRLLTKTLEGASTEFDGSVRDPNGVLLTYFYGNDGLNPEKLLMINDKKSFVDVKFVLETIRSKKQLEEITRE